MDHFVGMHFRTFPRQVLKITPQQERFHRSILSSTARFGLRFLKRAAVARNHGSIRDVVRLATLYEYFSAGRGQKVLRELWAEDAEPDGNTDWWHWMALMHAVSLAFYLRLEETTEGEPNHMTTWSRARFAADFEREILSGYGCPAAYYGGGDFIRHVLRRTLASLFSHADTSVHTNIVCTDALAEHLFAICTAVDAGLPLILLGPAGVSKTLSFKLAMWNLEEARRGPFALMVKVKQIRFQCADKTTDAEIREVYQRAEQQKAECDLAQGDGLLPTRVVVLFDEAGNTMEEKMPMKEMHYHLDHPRVVTILLTNEVLDAAKTNRCCCVLQMMPQQEALEHLALGILFGVRLGFW